MEPWMWICIAAATLILGLVIGSLVQKRTIEARIGRAEESANRILEDAKSRAEVLSKERISEAKEEVHRLRSDCEADCRERRAEVTKMEKRVLQREEQMDKKMASLEAKEERFVKREKELDESLAAAEELNKRRIEALEKVAGLSSEEAKQALIESIENEARHDAALKVRDIEAQAKSESDKIARNIITMAIQRCAADHVAETTVSVVALPNDEMKGRIIGREGRNIKAIETATGVELIIDDTPEAVILSSFDPVRRDIARIALERLIVDGRIHPTRIEDMVEKARKEVEQQIKEAGEATVFDAGIHNIHPELVKILGRLKYRTSYGQNVLKHSLEVSYIAGLLAGEIGADITLAKRAGLLHDIGKAVDHEIEGTHIQIGVDLAKKYRENAEVIHCIAAHHNDIEPQTVEAVLVQAADAISGARPGARRETLEAYIKRLEQLEEIANSFNGVEKSFAVQAGREIRIIVKPEVVSEEATVLMAKDIAKRIETDMVYPGQIKVNVVRETRKVEYAK
ncbi:MAG: ribonuclease Y [Clostridia bacterium]|nr:ribonuclease Y [Clostridia bacterium]